MEFVATYFFYLASCVGIYFGQQGVFLAELAQPPFLQIAGARLTIKTSNSKKYSALFIYKVNLKVDEASQSILLSARQALGQPYKDEFEIDLADYKISVPPNYSFYWLDPDGQKTKLEAPVDPAQAKDVELKAAVAMVQAWISYSRASARDITGSTVPDAEGRFLVRIKGAIFRYDPVAHQLLVSGLVRYKVKILSKYPDYWEFLVRTGQRESTSMMYGEAQFELLREQLFEFKPDVVLLTKVYTTPLADPTQLGVQINWLLLDADYWFVNRYNEVMGKSEADLIKEAPELNQWMLKNRPKPW